MNTYCWDNLISYNEIRTFGSEIHIQAAYGPCGEYRIYILETGFIPSIEKALAITLAVASHSNNLPMFTLMILPKSKIMRRQDLVTEINLIPLYNMNI